MGNRKPHGQDKMVAFAQDYGIRLIHSSPYYPPTRAYNKHVKSKRFFEGDLVWKAILPIGSKDPKLGKWSPNWEGSFLVSQVIHGGAYRLVNMQGDELNRAINGRYLKLYYPSVWEEKI